MIAHQKIVFYGMLVLVFFLLLACFMASCQPYVDRDVLNDLGKEVLKTKQGIDIQITPEHGIKR